MEKKTKLEKFKSKRNKVSDELKISLVSLIIALFAILILPNVSHASGISTPYDEQLGITFTQDYTSLAYNVTAVAQSSGNGYGPAYLLNGYSNTGYWYQVGLSYNWLPNQGWAVNYEVFDPNGRSIYPQNGGGGTLEFNGPINQGDKVLLNLYFSGGSVIMLAKDLNTGSSASTSYSAEGGSTFLGNPYATETDGYFTGLMTEWYHSNSYYGNEQGVNYSVFGGVTNGAGWLWADEFYCVDVSCYQKQNIFWNSTASPISFTGPLYEFYSNGATEYANSQTYITGSYPANNITTTTISSKVTPTTINYLYSNSTSIINIQYNTTLPQIVTSGHIISIPGIDQSNNFYLTDPTDIDLSGISNFLNATSSSMNNIVLLDLSGVGNNITIVDGNISIDLSGINNIVTLKNAKARILAGISGINNTIYLINSTLIGGNNFGIDNKIISYQRGTVNLNNSASTFITTTQNYTTTIPYVIQNVSSSITATKSTQTTTISYNNEHGSGSRNILSSFFDAIINFFDNLFSSNSKNTTAYSTVATTSTNPTTSTTINKQANCQSVVNVGTDGTESTSGSCTGFIVNIGTNGDYTNYGNACPSIVNIGTNGDYYNNVSGCNPTVNVGTNGDYHNVNT